MANSREDRKRMRLQKLTKIIQDTRKAGKIIDKNKLISTMIVEHAVSRKTAVEEIDAVMSYDFE